MVLQLCESPFSEKWVDYARKCSKQEKSYYLEKLIVRLSDINCFILLLNCIFFFNFFAAFFFLCDRKKMQFWKMLSVILSKSVSANARSLLTRGKSIDIYLPNAGKEKKMWVSIACAGREAFMICLSYNSEILFTLFPRLLLIAAQAEANRFASEPKSKKIFPQALRS